MDAGFSGLPPFLTQDSGINSGFMTAHVTAAALASENKSLAHPASVDSLPTSANQEDHVSMATFAARRLGDMADNVAGILAVELLAGVQGIEFSCTEGVFRHTHGGRLGCPADRAPPGTRPDDGTGPCRRQGTGPIRRT